MNVLQASIPIGLGDILYVKAMLDNIRNRYDKIILKFNRDLINICQLDQNYNQFLNEIGSLLFSDSPYILTEDEIPFYYLVSLCQKNKIDPVKPNLKHFLCKGSSLKLNQDYIVIVTKVRDLLKKDINHFVQEMWQIVRQLSNKCKVVILGERHLQINAATNDSMYSIYENIIENISAEHIIDLSISKASSKLSQVQQDCLIMSEAKFILTLGIGGSFCMATASGNVIGYRQDEDPIANLVFDKEYPDAIVTKDRNKFMQALKEYL